MLIKKNNIHKILLFISIFAINFLNCSDKSVLTATSKIDNDWKTGYQMSIKLKNNSANSINDWKLEFDLKNKNEAIGSLWNGNFIQNEHHVIVTPPSWAGGNTICPKCELDIGFVIKDAQEKQFHDIDNLIASTQKIESPMGKITDKETKQETPKRLDTQKKYDVKKEDAKKTVDKTKKEQEKIELETVKVEPVKYEPINSKIVVYYASWSRYWKPPANSNQTGDFSPKSIQADNITHINYAFIKPLPANELEKLTEKDLNDVHTFRKILTDPWADIEIGQNWSNPEKYAGNIGELNDLKKQYPHLKTLISVGGWTLSDQFSQIAANPIARTNLFKLLINFCKYYNFDGIDFDWEYPVFEEHGGRPEDKKNFTIFLSEIYNMAKKEKNPLLVTIAAPAGADHMQNIEFDKIHLYLDWINVMTYDFHGPWGGGADSVTNHTAPLYATKVGDKRYNVDFAINYYLANKVPANKIVLGLNFNGRSYGNVESDTDGLFSSYKGPGPGTIEDGVMAFPQLPTFDLKTLKASGGLLDQGYKRYWDDISKVPYLFGNPGGRFNKVFITYDDLQSFKIKIEYLKKQGLAGVMFWQLDWNVWPTLAEIKRLLE